MKKSGIISTFIMIIITSLFFTSVKISQIGYNHAEKSKLLYINKAFASPEEIENFDFTGNTVALVSHVEGEAEILPAEKDEWKTLKTGDVLSYKDTVKTGTGGKLKIIFSDGSTAGLSPESRLEFQKGEEEDTVKGILSEGKIWCNIKNTPLEILTEEAIASIKEGEVEVEVIDEKTVLTVIRGNIEFSNHCGSVTATDKTESNAPAGNAPSEPKSLSDGEILEKIKWSDFGNPRIMVLIEEVNPDKTDGLSVMESTINSELSNARYHLIDAQEIEIIRKSDEAKEAITGDPVAAATLGLRLESDIIITGRVETEYVGKIETSQNTLITCQARCDIRAVVADTAQIILSKKLSEKATGLSEEGAGKKAIEKISSIIAEELVWEIPLNYAIAGNSHRTIQIIIKNCDFSSRTKIIDYLKNIPETNGKVYPRNFENSIAVVDIEYTGSSESLAEKIVNLQEPEIEITAITMNRIEINIIKDI